MRYSVLVVVGIFFSLSAMEEKSALHQALDLSNQNRSVICQLEIQDKNYTRLLLHGNPLNSIPRNVLWNKKLTYLTFSLSDSHDRLTTFVSGATGTHVITECEIATYKKVTLAVLQHMLADDFRMECATPDNFGQMIALVNEAFCLIQEMQGNA